VVASLNPPHLQLSLARFLELDTPHLKVGQVIPAEVRSVEEMGCHLLIDKCRSYRFFLPRAEHEEEVFAELSENKQVIVTVMDVDHTKKLVKVQLSEFSQTELSLRGVEEE
jgi:translation initiation factor 2 alpha subunit (eIF-2alpha)